MPDARRYVGQHVLAIPAERLQVAVRQLAHVDRRSLAALKIRSGEHLAAIALTALLQTPPVEVDTDGGVDLLFDVDPDARVGHSRPGMLAVEVKSLPGRFREFHVESRTAADGALTHTLRIGSIDELATAVATSVKRAAAKLGTVEAASRHAFIVAHPMEYMPFELVDELLSAPFLPPLEPPETVDVVWLLWSGLLAFWMSSERRWTQVLLAPDLRDVPEDLDDPWEGPELKLLDLLGHSASDSPFRFGIDVS